MKLHGELESSHAFRQRVGRKDSGGALIMAVAGLLVVVSIIVVGVSLITHIGIAGYYRDRIEFVARQGAQIAAGELYWAGAPRTIPTSKTVARLVTVDEAAEKAVPVVNNLLSAMGLPAADSIEVTADDEQATVKVVVKGLALPRGSILPSFLNLQVSASKRFDEDLAPAVLRLSMNNRTMIAIPATDFRFALGLPGLEGAFESGPQPNFLLAVPPSIKKAPKIRNKSESIMPTWGFFPACYNVGR